MPMESPSSAEARKAGQIGRINELSQLARTAWFSLLGYLVFVGITLLGVNDADFFVPSRQTDLPVVNVAIPTASFFWTAPILGAALYTYLHLFLIKLWDAHGQARTTDADPTHHWLVNDFVLIRRRDPVARGRPLAILTDWVTRFLVWASAPLVLAYAWWRSMPAHNEWLTLLIAACLWVTLVVGFVSWWRAQAHLESRIEHRWTRWGRRAAAALAGLLLVVLSWLRTEGGLDAYSATAWTLDDVSFTAPPDAPVVLARLTESLALARTDLSGVDLVPLPENWRTPETARSAFREVWCRREGLSMSVCDHPSSVERRRPAAVEVERTRWCEAHDLDDQACATSFDDLDLRFVGAWREERDAALANLTRLDMSNVDLRRVLASGSSFVGANLSAARLEGALLYEAGLEGANLAGARLTGAILYNARLENADLTGAQLERADLIGARLSGAELLGADLRQAKLQRAILTSAFLWGADLEQADLLDARMEWAMLYGSRLVRANLSEAHLEFATLVEADLREANWNGASTAASLVQGADLRGAQNLTQAQLADFVGDAATLLPDGPSETGEPYFVWSCWETPPPEIDWILRSVTDPTSDEADRQAARDELVCSPGNPRRRTGTPLALDAPRPAAPSPGENG